MDFRIQRDVTASHGLAGDVSLIASHGRLFVGRNRVAAVYADGGFGIDLAVHLRVLVSDFWRRNDAFAELGVLHGHWR